MELLHTWLNAKHEDKHEELLSTLVHQVPVPFVGCLHLDDTLHPTNVDFVFLCTFLCGRPSLNATNIARASIILFTCMDLSTFGHGDSQP